MCALPDNVGRCTGGWDRKSNSNKENYNDNSPIRGCKCFGKCAS